MQTTFVLLKRKVWILLPVAIVFLSLLGVSSCNENKKKTDAQATLADGVNPTCMTLIRTRINNWIPQYTKPNNPEVNKISVIKFYPTYNPVTGSYDITARAYNMNNASLGSSLSLSAGVACGVNLPQLLLGQSYDVSLNDLQIINNADGNLVTDFDKIILTPDVYYDNGLNFLKFKIGVKIGDVIQARPDVLPCPPCVYCKPPCVPPEDSLPPVDSTPRMPLKKDTSGSKAK